MGILSNLPHTVTHHRRTTTTRDSSGGQLPSTSLVADDIRCFVQPAASDVITDYAKRQLKVTKSVFLVDATAFKAFKVDDRIVYDGGNYLIRGFGNLAELDRVFRVDVENEKGGQ